MLDPLILLALCGVGALAGALMSIGIPKDSVLRYETALKADKFVLVLNGDAQELEAAREVLETSGLSSFDHHHQQEEAEMAVQA